MLNGKFRGKDIGSGTDVWKFSGGMTAAGLLRVSIAMDGVASLALALVLVLSNRGCAWRQHVSGGLHCR